MQNKYTIRPAQPHEQKALEALQWRASLNNPNDREALLAHPNCIELPLTQIENGQVFVIEDANEVKGFAAWLARDDGNLELDGLFVEPEAWRRGYGKTLVAHCNDIARAQGAQAIYVVANLHAEHFYLACGFKALGSAQTQFGIALSMRKEVV